MPKIEIPLEIKKWFREHGVDKLPEFLLNKGELSFVKDLTFEIDGLPRVIAVDGTAATALINLRPASGKRWFVIEAIGYHDDITSRTCKWQFYDGTNTVAPEGIERAATTRTPIGYHDATFPYGTFRSTSIILTRDVYAQWNVASIGSGKKGYIRALVLELDE